MQISADVVFSYLAMFGKTVSKLSVIQRGIYLLLCQRDRKDLERVRLLEQKSG